MPGLNKSNEKRIKEQIIQYLYENYPNSYTSKRIGKELIRNNEFTARLLKELEEAKVVAVNQNKSKFFKYYRLTDIAKRAYDNKV